MADENERQDVNEQPDVKPDVVLISVGSRIPDFWTDQPGLWFIQFEAAVSPQKASDESKYQLLIAKLGKRVIQQVADLLAGPPITDKYQTLKSRLMSVYEESESRRIQKLIGDMQLGEQKPSQLLRHMRNLAGDKIKSDALIILWQNHLPVTVRSVLAATTLTDSEKLATVADKIMESSKPVDVASVSHQDTSSLAAMVEKLSIEVAELSRNKHQNTRSSPGRSRSQSRGRGGASRSSSRDQKRLCYFHYRFREKAYKCRKPCGWKGKDANANQEN